MTQKRITIKKDLPPPWTFEPASPAEIVAIKALFAGRATPDQQGFFVDWFQRATAVGELEFNPAGERESNFAAGKRFIGLQFFTLAKTLIADQKQG